MMILDTPVPRRRRHTAGVIGGTAFAAAGLLVLSMTGSAAAVTDSSSSAKCARVVAAQDLSRGLASAATATTGYLSPQAVAKIKAATDTHRGARVPESAAHADRKLAGTSSARIDGCGSTTSTGTSTPSLAVRPSATTGSGYGYISWLVHYGQATSSWCGEASVSEMSATVPGPSPVGLSQATVANWLGLGTTSGTSVGDEVRALNNFVGRPDFNWDFYAFVWLDYNPTSTQRSTFVSRLQTDVNSNNSPVAGDAWEVTGGPHLAGHPNQTIFHWFVIGGWNTNNGQLWYTDSATSVWSSVPAYTWFNMNTAETIMGGRGYIW